MNDSSRNRRSRRKAGLTARPAAYWIQLSLGWVFVLLGVAGLFLPVLQGILFLVIGTILLSRVSPRTRLTRLKLRRRFPEWAKTYDAYEHRARRWLRRHFRRHGQ